MWEQGIFKYLVIKGGENHKMELSSRLWVINGVNFYSGRNKQPEYCKMFDISSDVAAGRKIILKSIGES
jgi:hypothetical protein